MQQAVYSSRTATSRSASMTPRHLTRPTHQGMRNTATMPRMNVISQARRQRSSGTRQESSTQVLTSFYFGRAFATVISERISELLVDVVSNISRNIAERPQRITAFQEEVAALASKEMGFSTADSPSGSTGLAKSTKPGGTVAIVKLDLQETVDDLRAEIASARNILKLIRTSPPKMLSE